MMKWVMDHTREIGLFLILTLCYFLLRLVHLTDLPLFTDEAIYLRWAQIAGNDANWRFIALTDGKQPLLVWITMVVMKFITDPLLAGRLVSVFTGFGTMLGLFVLTQQLFKNKSMAFIVVVLYIAFPFAQVHDRMALMDSMVAMFYVWAVYLSILLIKYVRLDIAYTLGFVIGLGTLTKSTGFYNILLLPVTLLFFDLKQKNKVYIFLKWVFLVLIAILISQALYGILRLSPFFHMIEQKNATFIYPLSEWITHPFTYFFGNLIGLATWFWEYMKLPYTVLVLFALIFIKHFPREKLVLFLYFLGPFLSLALFGKVLYPRYILFMTIILLPLAAWSIEFIASQLQIYAKAIKKSQLSHYGIRLAVVLLFIAYPLFVSYQFATNPVHAAISKADSNQYINSWNAGWGVNDIVTILEKEAENKKIYVATQGTFGLMPYGLELYLVTNKNITIRGFWPLNDDQLPEEIKKVAQEMPTYFLFYQPVNEALPGRSGLEVVYEKTNGKSTDVMRLYKVPVQ